MSRSIRFHQRKLYHFLPTTRGKASSLEHSSEDCLKRSDYSRPLYIPPTSLEARYRASSASGLCSVWTQR